MSDEERLKLICRWLAKFADKIALEDRDLGYIDELLDNAFGTLSSLMRGGVDRDECAAGAHQAGEDLEAAASKWPETASNSKESQCND